MDYKSRFMPPAAPRFPFNLVTDFLTENLLPRAGILKVECRLKLLNRVTEFFLDAY